MIITDDARDIQAAILFFTAWLNDLAGDDVSARRAITWAMQWAPPSA